MLRNIRQTLLGGGKTLKSIFSLCLIFQLSACEEPPREEGLLVGLRSDASSQIFYLAEAMEYFPPEGIHLVTMPLSVDPHYIFQKETFDVMALPLSTAITWAEMGEKISVILVLSSSNGGASVVFNPRIRNLKGLSNLTIAGSQDESAEYVIKRMTTLNAIPHQNISFKTMIAENAEKALLADEVDAAVLPYDATQRLKKLGYRSLFSTADIAGEVLEVLVVRTAAIAEHEEHLRQLVAGWRSVHENFGERLDARPLPEDMITAQAMKEKLQGMELTSINENLSYMAQNGRAFDEFMFNYVRLLRDDRITRLEMSYPLIERQFIFSNAFSNGAEQ